MGGREIHTPSGQGISHILLYFSMKSNSINKFKTAKLCGLFTFYTIKFKKTTDLYTVYILIMQKFVNSQLLCYNMLLNVPKNLRQNK